MMQSGSSTIQRAYELAQSGQYSRITELVTCLREEGYYDAQAQLDGPMIRHTLRRLMAKAHEAPEI